MKKKIIAVVIMCLFFVSFLSVDKTYAAQFMCFTAVNDELLPLDTSLLPAYFGAVLYVPGNLFTKYLGLSAGYNPSENRYYLYKDKLDAQRLDFYIDSASTYDETGRQYFNKPAQFIENTVFLPLELMCEYFGFNYSVIPSDPISVLRIKNTSAITNDKTFVGLYREEMRRAFDEYYAPPPQVSGTPDVYPTAQPSQSITEPPVSTPTFENVTLYFSFYNIETKSAKEIMDSLEKQEIRGCFYLSETEIRGEPNLVREIAGRGHTIGIWLETGEYEEYLTISALLFEVAKIKTPLVASFDEAIRESVVSNGLVFRGKAVSYDASKPESRVPTVPGARTELRLQCEAGQSRFIADALQTLIDKRYTISIITETTPEVNYG